MTETPSSTKPQPAEDVMDLYKLSVEMADRVSARRGQANQFYLTLQTLLLGVPALATASTGGTPTRSGLTLLATVGAIVALVWWLHLRSYRDLNRAKFAVINKIEAEHFTVRPFTDEWSHLRPDKVTGWRRRYAELGTVERLTPWVFLGLNLVVAFMVWT